MIRHPLLRVVRQYGGVAKAAALSPSSSNMQLAVMSAAVHNRAGGANDIGLLRLLAENTSSWKIWRKATSTYTDQTANIQAGTAVAFFASNNDDLFIGAKVPFGLFGMDLSVDEAGSPVYTMAYYNGSSFTTLTTVEAVAALTTQEILSFLPPYDWAKGTGIADITSSSDYYWVRIRSTTAPSTPPQINNAWVAEFLAFREGVADNGTLEILCPDASKPLVFQSGEGLVPYFKTANANNTIEVSYCNLG